MLQHAVTSLCGFLTDRQRRIISQLLTAALQEVRVNPETLYSQLSSYRARLQRCRLRRGPLRRRHHQAGDQGLEDAAHRVRVTP